MAFVFDQDDAEADQESAGCKLRGEFFTSMPPLPGGGFFTTLSPFGGGVFHEDAPLA